MRLRPSASRRLSTPDRVPIVAKKKNTLHGTLRAPPPGAGQPFRPPPRARLSLSVVSGLSAFACSSSSSTRPRCACGTWRMMPAPCGRGATRDSTKLRLSMRSIMRSENTAYNLFRCSLTNKDPTFQLAFSSSTLARGARSTEQHSGHMRART